MTVRATLYDQEYLLTLIHVSFEQTVNHMHFVLLVGMPKNLPQAIKGTVFPFNLICLFVF